MDRDFRPLQNKEPQEDDLREPREDKIKSSESREGLNSDSNPEPRVVTKRKTHPIKAFLYLILALMMIVLATFGGWWYGQDQAKTESSTKIADLEKQIAVLNEKVKSSQHTNQADNQNDNSKKYLEIKEWEVRIPLNSVIDDALYVIGNKTAYLGTARVVAKSDCDIRQRNPDGTPKSGGEGTITRDLPTARAIDGRTLKEYYPEGKQIGQYYYYFVHPQSTCSRDGVYPESKTSVSFQEAFKGIEAIN